MNMQVGGGRPSAPENGWMYAAVLVSGLVLALVLAGCGGSVENVGSVANGGSAVDGGPAVGGGSQLRPAASATAGEPGARSELASGGGGRISADEFCATLTEVQPKLAKERAPAEGKGSTSAKDLAKKDLVKQDLAAKDSAAKEPAAAKGALASAIAALYESKRAPQAGDGRAMDEMGEARCPDAVAKVLKAAGITTFTAL
jgi:hypothetical protein